MQLAKQQVGTASKNYGTDLLTCQIAKIVSKQNAILQHVGKSLFNVLQTFYISSKQFQSID